MIVCRKPCTLYDVDLIGIAVVGALLLGTVWLVVLPWRSLWIDYRALLVQRAVADARLQQDLAELKRFESGLLPLERTVADQGQAAPRVSALPQLLRELTDVAAAVGVEVHNVTPQPAKAHGAYLVSDIRVGGRGTSLDFIRYLDRMARENPYQALHTCTIARAARNDDPRCELTWTVRQYLLPTESAQAKGRHP